MLRAEGVERAGSEQSIQLVRREEREDAQQLPPCASLAAAAHIQLPCRAEQQRPIRAVRPRASGKRGASSLRARCLCLCLRTPVAAAKRSTREQPAQSTPPVTRVASLRLVKHVYDGDATQSSIRRPETAGAAAAAIAAAAAALAGCCAAACGTAAQRRLVPLRGPNAGSHVATQIDDAQAEGLGKAAHGFVPVAPWVAATSPG